MSVEPLSVAELAKLRRDHVASGSLWFASSQVQVCAASNCNQGWPCDAARLLATLDAATQAAPDGLDVERLARTAIVPWLVLAVAVWRVGR